mgnify:CR=1 FL=1
MKSNARPQAVRPNLKSRYHHGIDFKNPFTMSKRSQMLQYRYDETAADLVSSSLENHAEVVEPIGIEPMT